MWRPCVHSHKTKPGGPGTYRCLRLQTWSMHLQTGRATSSGVGTPARPQIPLLLTGPGAQPLPPSPPQPPSDVHVARKGRLSLRSQSFPNRRRPRALARSAGRSPRCEHLCCGRRWGMEAQETRNQEVGAGRGRGGDRQSGTSWDQRGNVLTPDLHQEPRPGPRSDKDGGCF